MKSPAPLTAAEELKLLSVVIPARDEEGCIASTVEHLHVELRLNNVPHEIIVVDDGSTDRTAEIVTRLSQSIPQARLLSKGQPHGFGHAITAGLMEIKGDAAVVMMADESDDCRDVVRYWKKLNEGWDAVFGSRFLKGGGVIDYPLDQAAAESIRESVYPDAFWHFAQRHHECLQGVSVHRDRGLHADALGAFQSHGRASAQNDHPRIFVDHDSHYLAQPQNG